MRKINSSERKTVASLYPIASPVNRYVDQFSKALADQNYIVREFRWRPEILFKTNVIILHWPTEFFSSEGKWSAFKSSLKLALIWLLKYVRGTRFVWVAHNAAPHEAKKLAPRLTGFFMRTLDGIIYLSASSRQMISDLYPQSRGRNSLVTVHGHYRDVALTPLSPRPVPNGVVKLAYVGLVRPYKNLEVLVEEAAKVSGLELRVSGIAFDRAIGEALRAGAGQARHITLDLWESALEDAKFEGIIDSADAVVLPYRNILNSGAALFALSRNRPILAPNIGSLPELRAQVGADWVYLYDGEFNHCVLTEFLAWMRTTKSGLAAPLDSYAWSRIGRDLGQFIQSIRS
jgi:beta-1,4-mannosyltransferase